MGGWSVLRKHSPGVMPVLKRQSRGPEWWDGWGFLSAGAAGPSHVSRPTPLRGLTTEVTAPCCMFISGRVND